MLLLTVIQIFGMRKTKGNNDFHHKNVMHERVILLYICSQQIKKFIANNTTSTQQRNIQKVKKKKKQKYAKWKNDYVIYHLRFSFSSLDYSDFATVVY